MLSTSIVWVYFSMNISYINLCDAGRLDTYTARNCYMPRVCFTVYIMQIYANLCSLDFCVSLQNHSHSDFYQVLITVPKGIDTYLSTI